MIRETRLRLSRLGGTTIRARMTLSMIYAVALALPVVLTALFYIRQMNEELDRIVGDDIELMQTADRISLEFLEARRDEKNFLLYRDSAYLVSHRESVARIRLLASRGRAVGPELAGTFDSIIGIAAAYSALADSLTRLPRSELIRADGTRIASLRSRHSAMLEAAAATQDTALRDSLLDVAARLASETGLALPTGGVGAWLNDSIRTLQASLYTSTDGVTAAAKERILRHRRRARQLAAWGQRNIVTVQLVVLIVLVWLIVVLPSRAVLPIKYIINALRRAQEGNLDIRLYPRSRDEIGQLAQQINRTFARLRDFDDRKVSRILYLERRFRLLANDIGEGVLAVDRGPNVAFANAAIEPLLGCRAGDATGRPFREFRRLAFLDEALERVLAGATSSQTCDVHPQLPGSAVCIEGIRDANGNMVGALLVVSNPPGDDAGDQG